MTQKTLRIGLDGRMFSDSFTGIGRYTFELSQRLFAHENVEINGQKYAVQWVIFMNEPSFSRFDFPPQVEKVLVNTPHYSLKEQTTFARQLYKANCDLVHFTHFNLPLAYRRPFTMTIHDMTISFFPGKKMNSWWRQKAYQAVFSHAVNNSRALITVSHNTTQDVEHFFPQSQTPITTIHNGLSRDFKVSEPAQIEKTLKKYQISAPFLLYTGVWREHKNLLGLIRAFARLRAKHPDLQLVLTGNPDPNYPEIEAAIKTLKLETAVKRVGLVPFDDLVALYNGAKVFVFPSFYEGFGFPPLEAMLCQTPVCASNTSSIPEVCGKAACFFDPRSVSDMTESIDRVLTDQLLRKQLIEQGLQRVKLFDWDECADQTWEVVKRSLN